MTELSCAASRWTIENGFAVSPRAREGGSGLGDGDGAVRSCSASANVVLESEDVDEEAASAGGGGGFTEKMMTRPSDPPVTRTLFESWT